MEKHLWGLEASDPVPQALAWPPIDWLGDTVRELLEASSVAECSSSRHRVGAVEGIPLLCYCANVDSAQGYYVQSIVSNDI